jgi:hypothetical protein
VADPKQLLADAIGTAGVVIGVVTGQPQPQIEQLADNHQRQMEQRMEQAGQPVPSPQQGQHR